MRSIKKNSIQANQQTIKRVIRIQMGMTCGAFCPVVAFGAKIFISEVIYLKLVYGIINNFGILLFAILFSFILKPVCEKYQLELKSKPIQMFQSKAAVKPITI